jgi:hypothetical protein
MRRLTYALLLAVALVAGMVGYALADIPDTHPSSPDTAHTLYLCVYPIGGPSALKTPYVLDKSLGNCPSNMQEVRLVPSTLP